MNICQSVILNKDEKPNRYKFEILNPIYQTWEVGMEEDPNEEQLGHNKAEWAIQTFTLFSIYYALFYYVCIVFILRFGKTNTIPYHKERARREREGEGLTC